MTEQARAGKVRVTFLLPAELAEKLRDTVMGLCGPPTLMTMTALAEAALRSEIRRLEREHNGGEPFGRRGGELRRGRPVR